MIDAEKMTIEPDSSKGTEFTLPNAETGVLSLKLETDDQLKVDNQAWAVLDPTQRARLMLITPGNLFLESALTTDRIKKYAEIKITTPEYLEGEEYKKDAAEGAYDLIIFDECRPATPQLMPLSPTPVFFGVLPPDGSDSSQ